MLAIPAAQEDETGEFQVQGLCGLMRICLKIITKAQKQKQKHMVKIEERKKGMVEHNTPVRGQGCGTEVKHLLKVPSEGLVSSRKLVQHVPGSDLSTK